MEVRQCRGRRQISILSAPAIFSGNFPKPQIGRGVRADANSEYRGPLRRERKMWSCSATIHRTQWATIAFLVSLFASLQLSRWAGATCTKRAMRKHQTSPCSREAYLERVAPESAPHNSRCASSPLRVLSWRSAKIHSYTSGDLLPWVSASS